MSRFPALWPSPAAHIKATRPDNPVLYFQPERLQSTARSFLQGFPGLVTYAVKANDDRAVIENLVAAGLRAFDVASPDEMKKVRAVLPSAVLHYNNPVRSRSEIEFARKAGVKSYSVDDLGALEKLADLVPGHGVEVSVRLKLPVKGAAYDFGTKFGADPEGCISLLRRAETLGFEPAMTFHPGTQCEDPAAWSAYIMAAADVSARAGVRLRRLNVGGGFPSHRRECAPELNHIFRTIGMSVAAAFVADTPQLICEPGRAMVAEAVTIAAQVKTVRSDGAVFLNDGIYGGLQEAGMLGAVDRIEVLSPDGRPRTGAMLDRVVFGPTCDSLDRMAGTVRLPLSLEEEDYVLFDGMGAYSSATNTRFNGYGAFDLVTVGHSARRA